MASSYIQSFTFRAALTCGLYVAAWPLYEIAWWRYMAVVACFQGYHIFFGRDLGAERWGT